MALMLFERRSLLLSFDAFLASQSSAMDGMGASLAELTRRKDSDGVSNSGSGTLPRPRPGAGSANGLSAFVLRVNANLSRDVGLEGFGVNVDLSLLALEVLVGRRLSIRLCTIAISSNASEEEFRKSETSETGFFRLDGCF